MNKINSCERIDLSRLHESYFFDLAAVICFGAAALFINLNPTPVEILYLGVGLFLTSHAINRNMQFKFAQRLVSFPFGRWAKPEIIIDSVGVHLWPAGRYRTTIPWAAQPRVLGCVRHNGTPVALIETRTNSFYYFPMFTLPLGYVQFQRVLEFYSGYADARRSIGTPQGLVHVRSLMDFPVSDIAKDLHSQ